MITDKQKLNQLSRKLVTNEEDYMSSLRKNIDLYVAEKDITIREIANAADISLNTLTSILYGNVKDCKLSTTIALAKAFGISIDELVGCGTIDATTRESLQITRNLPENSIYLIRWFIRHQENLLAKHNGHKVINVMHPICQVNGNLKISNEFTLLDTSHITELSKDVCSRIYIGIKLPCEHYMPTYSPYDILLVANDREPHLSENSVIVVNGSLFIAKRKKETVDGQIVIRYYSIRDGRPRAYEEQVDEVIGYVADVYTESNKD